MHKRKTGKKFGRTSAQRKAFIKQLAHALVTHEHITTTEARAKEVRPYVEQLITKAKKQTLHAQRILLQRMPKTSALKLYRDIGNRYTDRNGGYTRIIRMPRRKSDGAAMARIEFV